MTWPTPQEYNEALQHPGSCFDDPDLRMGSVELTPLGLPRPITGNFASVYRLRCKGKDWAVRCFWREYADMQQRYAATSAHLRSVRLPYTVDFDYLPRGILVRGRWYPVLKMEWVEGQLLDDFVREHLEDRMTLNRLAQEWLQMAGALESASIAHGDLQHGNVLVVKGGLKLVDYDAMCVPALLGKRSHEIGHQHYQHPARTATDFTLHIDRFSVWVIYLSLVAVSVDPGLWSSLAGGDECLLLRRTDYVCDSRTPAMRLLTGHQDERVRSLALRLESFLRVTPEQVPALAADGAIGLSPQRRRGRVAVLARTFGRRGVATGSSGVKAPAWVQEQVHAATQRARTFDSSFTPPRAWVALSSLALVLGSLLPTHVQPAVLWPGALLIDGLMLVACFLRDSAVAGARASRRRARQYRRSLTMHERHILRLQRMKAEAQARADQRCDSLHERRARFDARWHRRRGVVERGMEEQLAGVMAALADLDRLEREMLRAALETQRERHRERYVRSAGILTAPLPGLPFWTKLRLWLAGVRSAGDVSRPRLGALKSLGGAQAAGLLAWRAAVVDEARRTAPRALDAAQRERIAGPYARWRAAQERLRTSIEAEHREMLGVLQEHQEVMCSNVDAMVGALRVECRGHCLSLDALVAEIRQELPRLHWQLAEAQRECEAFGGVTLWKYIARTICPLWAR